MEISEYSTIVLVGDYGYIRQIETTIKSLCCYHENLKIYIFNQDIPPEWFMQMRKRLFKLHSSVVDIKLFDADFSTSWYSKLGHINYMTYARYFIPKFVAEDVVLYLDSDLVVNENLSSLFTLNLGENYIAAARATYGLGPGFNAGVMLVNNKLWKEKNISSKLIDITAREHENLQEGDQQVLNMVIENDYILLDDTYNFQIGFDYGAHVYGTDFVFDYPLSPLPKIVHYISNDKPWNTFSSGRLREVWWYYSGLDWSEIATQREFQPVPLSPCGKLNCFTLTNTCDIPWIETIVRAVPECQFHIAAYTDMADNLTKLSQYENVTLYPRVITYTLKENIEKCDVFLNINRDYEFEQYVADLLAADKIILSFDTTSVLDDRREQVFSEEDVQSLLATLTSLIL